MAVAFRSQATTPYSGTVAQSVTISAPAGIAAGDLLIAMVNVSPNAGTVVTPAGWQMLHDTYTQSGAGSINTGTRAYWKVAGASEPSSYTFTHPTDSYYVQGSIVAYSGANPVNPFLSCRVLTAASASSLTDTGPTVIPAKTNPTFVVALGTIGAGVTLSSNQNTRATGSGGFASYVVADETWTPSGGAAAGFALTASSGTGNIRLIQLALNPDTGVVANLSNIATLDSAASGSGQGAAHRMYLNNAGTTNASASVYTNEVAPTNLMVRVLVTTTAVSSITAPAGWTLVDSNTAGSSSSYVYVKRATYADTAAATSTQTASQAWSVTLASSGAYVWFATDYTGVGSDVAVGPNGNSKTGYTATTTNGFPSVTPSQAGNVLLLGVTAYAPAAAGAATQTVGTLTLRGGVQRGGPGAYDLGIGVYDTPYTATAASPTYTHTASANQSDTDYLIALAGENAPPYAPTLTAPAGGAYVDLAAGTTFSWMHSDPNGDVQSAYALRRKVGAGAYEYWNASTAAWQGTEVFNTTATQSVTFASGKWSNGTTYNWSVATKDPGGLAGSYATDAVVTGSTAPTVAITAPTGTFTLTNRPTVTWTYSDAEGSPQVAFRLVIYPTSVTTQPGFSAGQAAGLAYDSGMVNSATPSHTLTSDLPNGTAYTIYLGAYQVGGQFGSSSATFTLSLDVPAAPTCAATANPTAGKVTLDMQALDNVYSANAASIETDSSAWFAATGCSIARSTVQALNGTASLAVTATAASSEMAAAAYSGPGSCQPGQTYTAAVSLRADSTTRKVGIRIDWSFNGTYLISTPTSYAADNAQGWRQVALSSVCPIGANAATLVVSVYNPANGEVHYIDAATVTPDPGANLIVNGDFESGPEPWSPIGASAPTVALSYDRTVCGQTSTKVSWVTGSSNGNAAFGASVLLNANKTYTVSAYVYCTGTGARLSVYGSGSVGANNYVSSTATLGSWQRLSLTFTTSGTGYVTVQVELPSAAPAGAVTYVDAVQMVEASSASPFVPATSFNLVRNPSFETDTSFWNVVAVTATSVPSASGSGSRAAQLVPTGADKDCYLTQFVFTSAPIGPLVSVGATITLPAAMVGSNIDTRARSIAAYTYDSSGAIQGGYLSTPAPNVAGTYRLTITGIPVPVGGRVDVRLYNGSSDPRDVVLWDAVQVENGSLVTPYFDGTISPATQWEASENFLPANDADFEAGTVGNWLTVNGSTLANSSARAYQGTKSLLVTLPTAAGSTSGCALNTQVLAPNTTYTVTAWVYNPSGGVASLFLSMQGSAVLNGAANGPSITVTNSWVRHRLTFTSSPTGGNFTLYVLSGAASTSGQTFYVDSVQLEQRAADTDYGATATQNSIARRQARWTRGGLVGLTTLSIERSADGGVTWKVIKTGQTISLPAQTASYDDTSAPIGPLQYRAKVNANA